jgi:hypothetical protein
MAARTEHSPAEQSYLGRVFDSYQNMMQIAACLREAARQRGLKQPHVLELSRRNTGLGDYLPDAEIIRYPTHQNNQPALSDPVALPFANKSFDGCLISDVYEHLPREQRSGLLREMLRVTDGLVLVGSPQESEIVTRFDRIVFDFIWGKYAERFEPLEQHVTFGLEPLGQTLESLKLEGADCVVALPCNYVYRWIHQILIYFDLSHRHARADLFEPFNRIYNERLSPYDYREPCYRYLILVATNDQIDLDELANNLKAPRETPAVVAETDGVLVETFRAVEARLADELTATSQELKRAREQNEIANQEIAQLHATIRQLQHDSELATTEIEHLRHVNQELQQLHESRGERSFASAQSLSET